MATDRTLTPPGPPAVAPASTHALPRWPWLSRPTDAPNRSGFWSRIWLALLLLQFGSWSWAAPTLSFGSPAPSDITDKGTSTPFAQAVLDGATSVTIRFPSVAGSLSGASGLSSVLAGSDIVYTVASGSQANLRGVLFTPVENRILMGTSEVTSFRLSASDGMTTSAEVTVNLQVTPANDPPSVSTGAAPARIFDNATSTPFATISFSDPDAGDVLTASITYTASHGVLAAGPGSPSLSLTGGPGNYAVSGTLVDLRNFVRQLVYNPTDNRLPVSPTSDSIETTSFRVTIRDTAGADNVANASQSVESFNDTPQILGNLSSTPVADNSGAVAVFTSLSIQDPDLVKSGGTLVPQPVTMVADLRASNETAGAGSFVGSVGVFTFLGTAAPAPGNNEVNAALHQLLFDPIPNRQPVGKTEARPVHFEARDSLNAVAMRDLSFEILSINDVPQVTVTLLASTLPDTGYVRPFKVEINDPDVEERFRMEIEVPPASPLASLGVFEPSGLGPYQADTAYQLQEVLGGIVFRSIANQAVNRPVTFQLKITDLHRSDVSPTEGTPVLTSSLTLTILGVNEPPQIAVPGTPIYRTSDDSSQVIKPFKGVAFSDPDSATLTVTLAIEGATPGSFQLLIPPPPAVTPLNGAPITFTGDAAAVTEAIRTVGFTASPRANRVVGQQDTIRLKITVVDGEGGTRIDQSTRVVVTSVNGAPEIKNVPALSNQPLRVSPATLSLPIRPFDFVQNLPGPPASLPLEITDDDGTNVVATLRIDNPEKGHFENLSGFVESDGANGSRSGIYTLTALPAAVTAAVRGLQYVVSDTYPFPASEPGLTTFTLDVSDAVLNNTRKSLTILVAEEPVNWLVTSDQDNGDVGTLRWVLDQIAASKSATACATFALPKYPAIIRLTQGPITLRRGVTLKGPGADLLSISGDVEGDGIPDVALFQVYAAVRMECLTLTHGSALSGLNLSGGAAYVGPEGRLTLISCGVRNSVALQWGGGIDVVGGSLVMENCLVRGNRTDEALGLGGGGVALFTDLACAFVNTTFSANGQAAANGVGGGALYVENATPASVLDILISHCTFAENGDASDVGATSLYANVFGSGVRVRNSIFADGQTRNLEVAGAASILSLGGNLSDDLTRTVLTQNGQPKQIFLLNHATDITSATGVLTLPIDETLHPLPAYQLSPSSRAIGLAVSPAQPLDQRGSWRDTDPDSGALERGILPRVVLNEIGFGAPSALPEFLEFYVPRDARQVALAGHSLRVNGNLVYSFAAGDIVVPGAGLIVASANLTPITCGPGTPVGDCPPATPVLIAGGSLGLTKRSVVELVRPDGGVLMRVAYVGQYVDPADPLNSTRFDGTSITLAPQLRGCAYLPHGIVRGVGLAGRVEDPTDDPRTPADSPGGTLATPFGSANGFPVAVPDDFIVDEDVAVQLPILTNDIEEDGTDRLVVVDVSPGVTPTTENDAVSLTALGGRVSVLPSGSPLVRASITYDPQESLFLKSLPVGFETVDTFTYTVVDIGSGLIESVGSSDGGVSSTLKASGHRLVTGEQVVVSDSGTSAYNGTHIITVVDADNFKISVPFVDNPIVPGTWATVNPRSPTARSQTTVSVTVLGANDPPQVGADSVPSSEVDEDTPVRLMGGPSLAGVATDFDTDSGYRTKPRVSGSMTLLGGTVAGGVGRDTDPDRGETASLRVIGVVSAVQVVAGYSRFADNGNVLVESPAHGLTDGTEVLISGYAGYSGYNGFHVIRVVDSNHFRLPIAYVDDVEGALEPRRGIWAILNDSNRLRTTTALGAAVRLDLRVDSLETSVVYDPTPSAILNALSVTDAPRQDSFYYAVADVHGAVSLGQVTLQVAGVNDAPVAAPDPGGLTLINPLVMAGGSLADTLGHLDIAYYLPSDAGVPNRAGVELLTADQPPARFFLSEVFQTDEETTLDLSRASLTGNDTDVDGSDVLRVRSVEATSRGGGLVALLLDGSVRYDPAVSLRLQKLSREEAFLDTFAITITDDHGGESTALVAVLVVGVNDTPVASDDATSTNEDTAVTLHPLVNDSDKDQDGDLPDNILRLVPDTQVTPLGATVIVGTDLFTYDPTTSAFLNGLALGQTATEAVGTVTMDGSFVFANDDRFQVVADGSGFLLEVTINDRNLTGTGRPVANFSGDAGRSPVRVSAPGHGLQTGMTVAIAGYEGGGLYNRTHRVEVLDADTFLIPVVFVDNAVVKGLWSRLRITSVTAGNQGGVVAIGDGEGALVYSPRVDFVGDEVFAYTLVDALGNSDQALVRVHVVVDQLNGNLQANADSFTVARGQSPLLDVLANDNLIPAPGQNLTLTRIVAQPVLRTGIGVGRDTVEIVNNRIRYLQTYGGAAPDYPYEVAFSYEVSGGGTSRAVGQAIVRVVERGGTLPTRGDAYAVLAGSVNNILTVLDNDRILPGSTEPLAVEAIVQAPSRGGTVQLRGDGLAVVYTPAAGFIGEELFTYRATDRLGGTGLATVLVTVGGLTTSSDFVAVPFGGGPVELDVLANDPILGSASVGVQLTAVVPVDPGAPQLGTMSLRSPDQLRLIFEPAAGMEGEQEFIYTVADQSVPPRQANGRVIVIVARESVRASSDFFGVAAGSSLNPLPVLANDVAIPDLGRRLAIISIGTGLDAPDHGGTVVVNDTRDGLIYTPAAGFIGQETFTYVMTDSRSTDTAKVVVNVGAGRLAANADAFMVFFDPAGRREFDLPVLGNDRVLPDGGELILVTGVGINDANGSNAPSEHGEVRITPGGGSLTYIARLDAVPPYTERFTYEVTDGTARRAQAEVLVRVENRVGIRELETNDDSYSVSKDSSANVLAVLENDGVKPAGTADWTITEVTTPTWGGVVVRSPRSIAYTPAPGFVGTSTFQYTVTDGVGGTATAMVSVKVGDLVLSVDHFAAISGSTGNLLDVLGNDAIRPETSALNYHLVQAGGADQGGLVEVVEGVVLYRPAAAASYPYVESFEYVVEDDSGGRVSERAYVEVHAIGSDRNSSEVQVTVVGVNDLPTIAVPPPGVLNITDKQTAVPFDGVVVGDVDNQGNEVLELRVVQSDPGAGRLTNLGGFVETTFGSGAWVISGTGAQVTAAIRGLIFVPTENYVPVPQAWPAVFEILVTDPHVTQPVAEAVTVNVQAVNDPPVITGTVAGQPVYYLGSVRPFASTLITEVDDHRLQPLTTTIRYLSSRGAFVSNGGFTSSSPGVLRFVGTAEATTTALRSMVFAPDTGNRLAVDLTPPPSSEETVFTLEVDDGFALPVVTDTQTSIIAYHSLVTKVLASDPGKPDQFGSAVGATRTLIVIGSPNRDSAVKNQGGVYVRARDAGGANTWGQVAQLDTTDPVSATRFGLSVSVSGDRIVGGASLAKSGSKTPGAVYAFEPTTPGGTDWQVNAVKLTSTDGANEDQFGFAVSLVGDFLAVGAPLDDDKGSSSGAVYIFRRTAFKTWVQVAKIVPADGAEGDQFGYAVSLSGNQLLVGAPFDEDNGKDAGSAYVFRRNADGSSWTQVRKLLPVLPPNSNDGHPDDRFGFAVSLDEDTLVVGSPRDNGGRFKRGSAYVFQQGRGGVDNWGPVAKIGPSDALDNDEFGQAVGVSRDLIVVGMKRDGKHSDHSRRSGSAWVYGRHQGGADSWGLIEKLDPPDNVKNDEFGRALSLACGTLVVGARKDDDVVTDSGSAYIFELANVKAPRLATPIPDQIAVVDQPFSLAIPGATFGDADVNDLLGLTVAGPGGGPLPAWLSFNPVTATLSGTPAAVNLGSVVLTVTATDRCGDSAVAPINLSVVLTAPPVPPLPGAPLTYQDWIARLLPARILGDPLLEASVWGRFANPDGDPFLNLEEYAAGSRLFALSAGDGPGLAIGVAPGGRMAVTYRRRKNDAGLQYTLEFSADLNLWTDAASLPKQELIDQMGYDLERVTCLLPADQLPPNLFLRVRITTN